MDKNDEVEMQKLKKEDAVIENDNKDSYRSIPELTRSVVRNRLSPINDVLNLVETRIDEFYKAHKTACILTFGSVFSVGFLVYFSFAVWLDTERAKDLIYVTAFGFFCLFYWLIKKFFGRVIWIRCLQPIAGTVKRYQRILNWIGCIALVGFLIFWICWDTIKDPRRLISLVGLVVYVLIGFLFSKQRDRIKWRPVVSGFALQFFFGLLILRTKFGFDLFKWMGDRVNVLLSFVGPGAELIFGKSDIFAFTVLPVVIYFSSLTYILYYLGVMQVIINKLAWILQVTMGTTPTESVNTAGNIFLGQTESLLLIRPFLPKMTKSEYHAVMTGGLATIAGSLMALYILFGVSASHLLSASVMSAPAALAMSKLMYPETEEPEFVNEVETEETEEQNIFEAISVGASLSIPIIVNIVVMMIAFVSIVSLLNGLLSWIGSMVGCPQLSFEFLCSYIFMPFAYLMGVDYEDSFHVAEMLGTKTFLTEFLAYKKLAKLIQNRHLQTINALQLSIRSEVISTYALCGFSNVGSMGVIMGVLSGIVPEKRTIFSQLMLRALIAATLACFMTASIAGLLYKDLDVVLTSNPTNATMIL